MPSSVNTNHPEHEKMQSQWRRARDLVSGGDAVRAAGELYVRRLSGMTDEEYRAYINRPVIFVAVWRTIQALSGLLFRKPPEVEAAASVLPMLEDVTGTGIDFNTFAQQVAIEDLTTGRLGILVDYPMQSTKGMTLADAQKLNIQPTMQLYKAEPFYNWKPGRVANKTLPVEIRLAEDFSYPAEGFENPKTETRYRVLDLAMRPQAEEGEGPSYRVRIYRINDKKEDEQVGADLFPLMNGKSLSYIPFYPLVLLGVTVPRSLLRGSLLSCRSIFFRRNFSRARASRPQATKRFRSSAKHFSQRVIFCIYH